MNQIHVATKDLKNPKLLLIKSAGRRSPGAQAELDAEAYAEAQEEVENLLESYFIQIDRAFNRLRSLGAATLKYGGLGLILNIQGGRNSSQRSACIPAAAMQQNHSVCVTRGSRLSAVLLAPHLHDRMSVAWVWHMMTGTFTCLHRAVEAFRAWYIFDIQQDLIRKSSIELQQCYFTFNLVYE